VAVVVESPTADQISIDHTGLVGKRAQYMMTGERMIHQAVKRR